METVGVTLALVGAASTIGIAHSLSRSLYSSLERRASLRGEGLTVVYEGRDPQLDIICIHGLGGDPRETWTAKQDGRSINWITDFVGQDIPDARILTYGYHASAWDSRNLTQTLNAHGNQLVEKMAQKRRRSEEKRPIIFIAHSLGGFIVKYALVHASAAVGEKQRIQKAIQLSTIGVLFFGTPQHPRRLSWKKLLNRMAEATMPSNPGQAHVPLHAQIDIFDLQNERYKSIESQCQNHCFFEGEKTQKLDKSSFIIVVPEATVVPDRPRSTSEGKWFKHSFHDRSHHRLVKFETRDQDYEKVIECIKRCREEEPEAIYRCNRYFGDLERFASPRPQSKITLPRLPSDVSQSSISDINDMYVKESLRKGAECARSRSWEEAIIHYQDAMRRCEKISGVNDPRTLELLRELARAYFEMGELAKAELLYKRIFVALQEARGISDIDTVNVLLQLVTISMRQSHHNEAMKYLLHVQKVQSCLLGEEHDETVSTLERTAALHRLQSHYKDAEVIYSKIIDVRQKKVGEGHSDVLSLTEHLAAIYHAQRKLRDAETLYKKVLAHRKAAVLKQREQHPGPEEGWRPHDSIFTSDSVIQPSSEAGLDPQEKERRHTAALVSELSNLYREGGNATALRSLYEEWAEIEEVSRYLFN